MILWSFLFTNPQSKWVSARVAAPDRSSALSVIYQFIDWDNGPRDIIVSTMGKIDVLQPTLVLKVDRV